jgi:hypothetical protein
VVLGQLQVASFGKFRPTICEDMVYHAMFGLGAADDGQSSSGNSFTNSVIILG